MTEVMLVISILILVLLCVLAFFLLRSGKGKGEDMLAQQLLDLKSSFSDLREKQLQSHSESLKSQQELMTGSQAAMNEQLSGILKIVNESLTKSQGNINEQLSSTGQVISDVQKKLGALEESSKRIMEIGKDISSLQDILKAPKLRGNLGEYLLGDLLKQIFPDKNYKLQHHFKSGASVDAVIVLGDGMVPIDSKFPLESFQRMIGSDSEDEKKKHRKEFVKSVKARIDEISTKYILPAEGTFDFAMMYIPAENVFYETVINPSSDSGAKEGEAFELFNYAVKKHIIPVSPNSLYAYLMSIVFGLKGFRIEQKAKEIQGELSRVQNGFSKFYGDFTLLGKHLKNAGSKYDESLRRAQKFEERVSVITGVKKSLEEGEGEDIGEDIGD